VVVVLEEASQLLIGVSWCYFAVCLGTIESDKMSLYSSRYGVLVDTWVSQEEYEF